MASKISFMLPYMIFMFFVIFVSVESARPTQAVNTEFFILTNTSLARGSNVTQTAVVTGNITPPVCEIEGFDAMLDGIGCGVSYFVFFLSMAFINTTFLALNVIIFLPLGLTFIWVLAEFIRGV